MNHHELTLKYQVFASARELSASHQLLLERAHEAMTTADARYSGFSVGAAILLEDGSIVLGGNQENAVFGLSLCAEHNAVATAASSFPKKRLEIIAITASHIHHRVESPVFPCGSCRQVLVEKELNQNTPIQILLGGAEMTCYLFESAADLLPFAFAGKSLDRY